MPEYKVLDDDPIIVQKTLNQWRHQFHLQLSEPKFVHRENASGQPYCAHMTVLVERTPK